NENKTIIFFQRCDWSHVVCIVFGGWKSYFSSRVRTSIWDKSFTSNYWLFNNWNWITVVGRTSDCLFRKYKFTRTCYYSKPDLCNIIYIIIIFNYWDILCCSKNGISSL